MQRLTTSTACTADNEASSDLQIYFNKKQGYRFQIPSDWQKTDKSGINRALMFYGSQSVGRLSRMLSNLGVAGADVLFVEPKGKAADIGVTVSPIRIRSLEQFGDLATVGERLLAVERGKVRVSLC